MNLLIYLFSIIICFSKILANPKATIQDNPIYPPFLNLESYNTIRFNATRHTDNSETKIYEISSKNNRRVDLCTNIDLSSFRLFNKNEYIILTEMDTNEKSCSSTNGIESLMCLNYLKVAWKKSQTEGLIYLGTASCEVNGIECYVWQFDYDENNNFKLFVIPAKSENEKARLQKIVMTRRSSEDTTKLIYKKISFEFNTNIDEKEFKVDDDVKCE